MKNFFLDRGQSTNVQQGYSFQGCNPTTQNCNNFPTQNTFQSKNNCNPLYQNCNITGYGPSTVIRTQQGGQTHKSFGLDSTSAQDTISASGDGYQQGIGGYNQDLECKSESANCIAINTDHGVIYNRRINISQEHIPENTACNPFTQNCDIQSSGKAGADFFIKSQLPKCNPANQNCRSQDRTINSQGTGHITGYNQQFGATQNAGFIPVSIPYIEPPQGVAHGCDSRIQNCGPSFNQNHGRAYGTTTQQTQHGTFGQHTGQFDSVGHNTDQYSNVGQNAGQHGTVGQKGFQHYGSIGQNSPQIFGQIGNGGNSNCDSRSQNCVGSSRQEPNSYNDQTKSWGTCNPALENCNNRQSAGNKQNQGEPKCPDGFQGLTVHPTDCKKFLNCANGQSFVQDCAPGTLFNQKIGNCDFPYNVDCEISESSSGFSSDTRWKQTSIGKFYLPK